MIQTAWCYVLTSERSLIDPADDVIVLIVLFILLSFHPIHVKSRNWLLMFHSPKNRTVKKYSRFKKSTSRFKVSRFFLLNQQGYL